MKLFLVIVWIWFVCALVTFFAIAIDLRKHPQQMKIMNWVWLLCSLWGGPIVFWIYDQFGRAAQRGPSNKQIIQDALYKASHETMDESQLVEERLPQNKAKDETPMAGMDMGDGKSMPMDMKGDAPVKDTDAAAGDAKSAADAPKPMAMGVMAGMDDGKSMPMDMKGDAPVKDTDAAAGDAKSAAGAPKPMAMGTMAGMDMSDGKSMPMDMKGEAPVKDTDAAAGDAKSAADAPKPMAMGAMAGMDMSDGKSMPMDVKGEAPVEDTDAVAGDAKSAADEPKPMVMGTMAGMDMGDGKVMPMTKGEAKEDGGGDIKREEELEDIDMAGAMGGSGVEESANDTDQSSGNGGMTGMNMGGASMPMGSMGGMSMSSDKPFWGRVMMSAFHCGAGCCLADIIGESVGYFWLRELAEWTLFWQWGLDYVLALIIGVLFQYAVVHPMTKLSVGKSLWRAFKIDFLSLTSWQIGMYAFMGFVVYVYPKEQFAANSVYFWFLMQMSMIVGLFFAYPMNWFLIKRGIKPSM